jgi:hypothetical protein
MPHSTLQPPAQRRPGSVPALLAPDEQGVLPPPVLSLDTRIPAPSERRPSPPALLRSGPVGGEVEASSPGTEVAQRILRLRRPGESWSGFANRLGLSRQVIGNFRNRKSGAALETVLAALHHGSVNPIWLLTGEGVPYLAMDPGGDARP